MDNRGLDRDAVRRELCDTPEHREQIQKIEIRDNVIEMINKLMLSRGVTPPMIAGWLGIELDIIDKWLLGGNDITLDQLTIVFSRLGVVPLITYKPY